MTIVCFDGEFLAADQQLTTGSFISGFTKKILKWSQGYHASTGFLRDDNCFIDWLESGQEIKFKPDKSFAAFFSVGPTLYYVDGHLLPYKSLINYAIGNSSEVAEGLMRAGFSAEEAVKEMIKTNIFCGGRVDKVKIE